MKAFFLLSMLFCFFIFAQDEDNQVDEFATKRLLEGTAKNQIEKDYTKEQEKKFLERLNELKIRAKNDDSNAMVHLGNLYYLGTGNKIFRQDLKKAVQWYQKATDLGNSEAMYNLGNCYQYGVSVEQNEKKALSLFELSVNNGLYEAAHKVGKLFENKKDFKKARRYYSISANSKGDKPSLKKIAKYNMEGIGGEKNLKKAFSFYSSTAFNGDADSQYILAGMYKDGIYVKQDAEKAGYLLELAANNGNEKAQCSLGVFYLQGLGKYVKSKSQALGWFQKSAKQGYLKAQLALAEIYDGIQGGEPSPKKAYKWYRLVAFRDEPRAMLKLAILLEFGRGVKENKEEALSWYEKAVARNYPPALLRLGQVYEQGIIVEQDIDKALDYYNKAIDLEFGEASIYLAKIYKEGKIVKKDVRKAFSLLKDAALKGYDPALEVLKNYN